VQGRRIVEVIDTAPLATDEAEAAEWAAGNGARLDAAALARGALEVSGTAILLCAALVRWHRSTGRGVCLLGQVLAPARERTLRHLGSASVCLQV
jgi:hypothetical protein